MKVLSGIRKVSSSKLFKSFSVYVASNFFNQGVSFLLIPVFTYYFTPTEYGYLSLINTTVSLLAVFIMVGSDGAIRREFFKVKDEKYAKFFSSSTFITVVSFAVISLLTVIFALSFPLVLDIPRKWLLLSPVIAFTSILPTILLGQYRVKQQAGSFAVWSNTMTLANLGLAVLFVVGLKMNYEGRLYSTLLVNSIFFIAGAYILWKQGLINTNIRWEECKKSLKYGLPIIPHQIGAFIIAFSDRYFIAHFVSVAEVGIYNVGYLVGGIIGILEGTFGYAFTPFLFEALTEGSHAGKVRVVKLTYLFLIFLGFCVLALSMLSQLLFNLFIGEEFQRGQNFVFWVALGYFFSGCYKMVTGYIFYSGKTIYLTYLAIVNIVLSIGLNYFLISNYGAMGAAYAACISLFVMFLMTGFISNTIIKMPWFSFMKEA